MSLEVAVTVTVPAFLTVRRPSSLIVAMSAGDTDHVTSLFVAVFGETSAVS